jgi:hypothetical protein
LGGPLGRSKGDGSFSDYNAPKRLPTCSHENGFQACDIPYSDEPIFIPQGEIPFMSHSVENW